MFEHNPYQDFEAPDTDLQARLARLAGRLGRSRITTLRLRKVPHKRFPKNGVQVIYDTTRRLAWI